MKIKAENFKLAINQALLIPVDQSLTNFPNLIRIYAESGFFYVFVANVRGFGIVSKAECEGELEPILIDADKLKKIATSVEPFKEDTKDDSPVKKAITVEIIKDNNQITVKYEKSRHKINVVKDSKDYGYYVTFLTDSPKQSLGEGFKNIIKKLVPLVNSKSFLPQDICIYINKNDVFVKSNTVFALIKTEIQGDFYLKIPLDTAKIIEKLDIETICFNGKSIEVEGKTIKFVSPTLWTDPEPTEYSFLTEAKYDDFVTFKRSDLLDILKGVSVTLEDDLVTQSISLKIGKDSIDISSKDTNENSTEVNHKPLKIQMPEEREYSVNGKHFASMVNFFETSTLSIWLPNNNPKFYYVKEGNKFFVNTFFGNKK